MWSNNENTQSITIVQTVIYSVTISDGCFFCSTAQIGVIEDSINRVNDLDYPDYLISPNPTNDFINIVIENEQNIELTLAIRCVG